jgi:hypothetical protein
MKTLFFLLLAAALAAAALAQNDPTLFPGGVPQNAQSADDPPGPGRGNIGTPSSAPGPWDPIQGSSEPISSTGTLPWRIPPTPQ